MHQEYVRKTYESADQSRKNPKQQTNKPEIVEVVAVVTGGSEKALGRSSE